MASASNMWQWIFKISTLLLIAHVSGIFARAAVIKLDEENWEDMLKDEWMVEFYAPWCPACKALQPAWEKFAHSGDRLGIHIGQVDVTASPGLSGRFMVTALPTIFHVLDGEFRQYRGARDEEAFTSFIREKKWKSVEAVPGWKSPGSFQMSIVSYFFKLSQILRAVHNNLMEEYGLPTWGSYLIFAIATIFIGALLGLVLVCVIDLIYPPKPFISRIPTVAQGDKSHSGASEHQDARGSSEELEEEDEYAKDDLVDEVSEAAEGASGGSDAELKEDEGSPNVRKRKPRKAD